MNDLENMNDLDDELEDETIIKIQNNIIKVLMPYQDKEFIDVKDNIQTDLKEMFDKYPEFVYQGYSTNLGSIYDMVVYFPSKQDLEKQQKETK